MGAFETKTAKVSKLPEDVPSIELAVREGHPDGAIFRSEPSGQRFRLRLARWVPVVQREKKPAKPGDAKPGATAPKK